MRTKTHLIVLFTAFIAFSVVSCKKEKPPYCHCSPDNVTGTYTVFAKGLNNPRGLKFGPDGYLYVAEGGVGGKDSTKCTQVIPPIGPYRGSDTGSRISKIDMNGMRTTAADHLPSSQSAGADVNGVADVAFIGNTLYGLLAGAGCSHGVAKIPNGVVKVNPNGTWSLIANLSAFLMSHPVKNPNADDFEPDGTPYSMINVDGNFYAIEPNHGELDKITPSGNISRVIDISASEGHIVPTVVVFHENNFYVGNLDTFPMKGLSSVFKITPGGHISVVASGFSSILGIAFDHAGALYVLENTTGHPYPTPGTGDVIRIDPSGFRSVLVKGLNLPTGMTFGPDEKLYISNWGFGPPAIGGGQILKVDITCAKGASLTK